MSAKEGIATRNLQGGKTTNTVSCPWLELFSWSFLSIYYARILSLIDLIYNKKLVSPFDKTTPGDSNDIKISAEMKIRGVYNVPPEYITGIQAYQAMTSCFQNFNSRPQTLSFFYSEQTVMISENFKNDGFSERQTLLRLSSLGCRRTTLHAFWTNA